MGEGGGPQGGWGDGGGGGPQGGWGDGGGGGPQGGWGDGGGGGFYSLPQVLAQQPLLPSLYLLGPHPIQLPSPPISQVSPPAPQPT